MRSVFIIVVMSTTVAFSAIVVFLFDLHLQLYNSLIEVLRVNSEELFIVCCVSNRSNSEIRFDINLSGCGGAIFEFQLILSELFDSSTISIPSTVSLSLHRLEIGRSCLSGLFFVLIFLGDFLYLLDVCEGSSPPNGGSRSDVLLKHLRILLVVKAVVELVITIFLLFFLFNLLVR